MTAHRPARLLAAAVVLTAVGPAIAATYTVDQQSPQAADSGAGTEEQPWLTIQHAADTAVAGDTVYVKSGAYVERVRLSTPGAEGELISFIATPRRSVLMHGFTIDEAHYVHVEGFEITSSDQFTGWDEAQGFFVRANHVTIVDNYIHDLSATAIAGYWHEPFPQNVHVADNTIYLVQMGITLNGSGWIVERNEVARLFQYGGGDCDYMRFFGTDHVIRHNTLHGTNFDEIGEAHVDCFQTFTNNGEEIRNILFDGNVCYDFHQGLMASNVENTDTGHFTFTNNIFAHGEAWGICVHDVSFIALWNNTFYDIQYHGAGFRGASTNNVVLNNIFAQMGTSYWGDEGGEVTGDFNLVFEAGDPGTPGANDLLGVDPQFVGAASDDLRIGPDSPAIDAGDELTEVTTDLVGVTRPQGDGWDIGAWEYLASPPLTIVTVSLPPGVLDEPYAAQLQAIGGTLPYDWAVEGGSLPAGLALDSSTGAIDGTPTSAGIFSFTAAVEDADGAAATRPLSITVPEQPSSTPGGTWPSDESGCGCAVVGRPVRGWLGPLLLLPLWLRRRRFGAVPSR